MRGGAKEDPIPRLIAVAIVAGATAWIAWQRYRFALGSPYPHGVDGYFYAAQLQSLLDTGGLRWPSPPLVFWLLWPLAAIAGPVAALKIGAVGVTCAIAAPVYGIAREIGAPRAASIAAAVVALTSPALFYFSVEFVKNGAGLALPPAAIWAVLVAARRGGRARWALAAAALLAAWLTHKSAAAIAAITAAPVIAGALRARGVRAAHLALGLAAAVVAALVAGVLAPSRFAGVADLGLVGQLFSSTADFELPVQRIGGRTLLFGREVLFAAIAALGFFAAWGAGVLDRRARCLAGLAALALVAALPWIDIADPGGPGFRLRLLAFVPLSLLAAALGGVAAARFGQTAVAAAGLALAGFLVAFRPAIYKPPVVEQHPAMVAAVAAARDQVPEGSVVITPERRLVFAYAFLTGGRAAQDPESVPAERRWRLVPLAYMSPSLIEAIERSRKQSPASVARPISLHPYARDGLLLLREDFWVDAVARLPDAEREHYAAWPRY